MILKKLITIWSCFFLGSCAPNIIQHDVSNDIALKNYKCLKTKYNSVLIQDISYCYGPIYHEQKRMWRLGYYGQKHVKYLLGEKERYENRELSRCSKFTNPAGQTYTDVVIIPKGTHLFVEQLWTVEASFEAGPSIGFIGKLNKDDSEYKFRFSDGQFLTNYTDGHKTYNNYEAQMYYEYWPYRDNTLKELKRVTSSEVSVKKYLDELYEPCD